MSKNPTSHFCINTTKIFNLLGPRLQLFQRGCTGSSKCIVRLKIISVEQMNLFNRSLSK